MFTIVPITDSYWINGLEGLQAFHLASRHLLDAWDMYDSQNQLYMDIVWLEGMNCLMFGLLRDPIV